MRTPAIPIDGPALQVVFSVFASKKATSEKANRDRSVVLWKAPDVRWCIFLNLLRFGIQDRRREVRKDVPGLPR